MAAVDARVVKSRAKMRAALLELVGEQKLESIKVADITERAGVGYATFFRHYTDPLDLWHDASDEVTKDLLAHLAPLVASADTVAVAREVCQFVADNREKLSAILAQGAEGVVRADLVSRAVALTEERAPRRRTSVPRDLAVFHSTNATFGILVWWLDNFDTVSVAKMAGILDRLVIRPLSP
jgi:AcrR family transcriptional regulator